MIRHMKILLKLFIKDYENTKDSTVRMAYGKLSGVIGILVNILLFIAKFFMGYISGSISITADAFNNLTDASSSVITLVGFKLSSIPPDKDHPYGHARYEYLAALVVAALTLVVGFELFISSGQKLMNPTVVEFDLLVVVVLIGSILVKAWLSIFNHILGDKINSKVLKATALDSRNDMISTGVVFLGLGIGHITGLTLDGYFGIFVAIFILYSGVTMIGEILSLLLGERPDPELVSMITIKIMSYEGVLGCHDLIVHDYGPGHRFASVHVEMDAAEDPLECHEIIDTIERDFKENENLEIVIHYDPILMSDGEYNDLKNLLITVLEEISPRLHFHDFRFVPSHGHINLIFDLVVPYDLGYGQEELKVMIDEILSRENKTYYTSITFDVDYV